MNALVAKSKYLAAFETVSLTNFERWNVEIKVLYFTECLAHLNKFNQVSRRMVTSKLMRDAVIIQDGGWIGADIVLKQTIQTNIMCRCKFMNDSLAIYRQTQLIY